MDGGELVDREEFMKSHQMLRGYWQLILLQEEPFCSMDVEP